MNAHMRTSSTKPQFSEGEIFRRRNMLHPRCRLNIYFHDQKIRNNTQKPIFYSSNFKINTADYQRSAASTCTYHPANKLIQHFSQSDSACPRVAPPPVTRYLFARHGWQASGPAVDLNVPAPHSVHSTHLLSKHSVPFSQNLHSCFDGSPAPT